MIPKPLDPRDTDYWSKAVFLYFGIGAPRGKLTNRGDRGGELRLRITKGLSNAKERHSYPKYWSTVRRMNANSPRREILMTSEEMQI